MTQQPEPTEPSNDNVVDLPSGKGAPTEPSLQQRLQDYYKAVEEEFSVDNIVDEAKGEELKEKARAKLFELTPHAAAAADFLLHHAESEAIKWQVTKYILDNALGKKGFAENLDPIEALVKRLTKPEPTKATTASTETDRD